MRRNRRGVNWLELVLVLPLFVVAIAGLFDFGWLAYNRAMTASAVHAGCRIGSEVDPRAADPAGRAEATMAARLADVGVPCTGRCTVEAVYVGMNPRRSLRCRIDRDVEPLFGLTLGAGRFSSIARIGLGPPPG